jgi:hypothetical protein
LLEDHFKKHGSEFKGEYKNADEYLNGALDVIDDGIKVKYRYKPNSDVEETRIGYIKLMGISRKGEVKFEFVGTNSEGYITTYHVKRGEELWKLLNGNKREKNITPLK